jgi:hypothetical protein
MWANRKGCTVWRGKVKERDQLEKLRIGGSIILKCILEIGVEIVDWFSLA